MSKKQSDSSAVQAEAGEASGENIEGKAARTVKPKPKKNKQRRGDDVRARVLQAALECFGAYGFEGASTRAIAEKAGVTHTLVLYHFQSKDQLWMSTVEYILNKYMEQMRQDLENNREHTALAAMKTFIDDFVKLSAEVPQIHRIFTSEGNQDSPRLTWVIDHFLRDHFNLVVDIIRRGQSEGTIRQCDPARLYYLIIGVGGTPFTLSTEYKALTGRNVFSETEILRNIAFLYEIIFT